MGYNMLQPKSLLLWSRGLFLLETWLRDATRKRGFLEFHASGGD